MPRISPYVIVLSDVESHELQKIEAQYTLPYCVVIRAKIALMAASGMENKLIGERLSLPRPIVSKWRKRFASERLAGLVDRPRRAGGKGVVQ